MTVLAHGVGGSTDLPIPLTAAMIGAAWALTATFAIVVFAWRTPKFDPAAPGRPVPAALARVVDSRLLRTAAAVLALALAVWAVIAGIFGPDTGRNALPGTFYVLLWVGLVVVSVLFGPVGRVISPLRTLGRFLPERTDTYPRRLGYWPAAIGLFAFVWLELASPDSGSVKAILTWIAIYAVVVLGGAAVFGRRWFARADPFEVYSTTVSRLSPWARRDDGVLVVRNPFHNLVGLPNRRGMVAVLSVLLGSTAYDSFSGTPGWRNLVDSASSGPWTASLLRTAGLLAFVGAVALVFCVAAQATGGLDRARRRELPGLFAHSLVPIVVGYIIAHYASFLLERGQQTIIYLLDPFDTGWNGLGDGDVVYLLSQNPTALFTVSVGAVVAGHIGGVVAAHDQALKVLPKGHELTGQLGLMLVMVFYTFTGLWLLFGS